MSEILPTSKVGANINKPAIILKHCDLEQTYYDSVYTCNCPACEHGLLSMRRNPTTFLLENIDRCSFCGQLFEYSDVPNNKLMSL